MVSLVAAAACGSTSGPMGPTTAAPQIACPADLTVRGITGSSQAITFNQPSVTGGAAPVTVTCAPVSGASFPLGTTPVNCNATDAIGRQSSCAFNLTVTGTAIGVTKYGAFGDSLTEGEMGRPSSVPLAIDPTATYPVFLQALFDQAYPGQGVSVINRGHSGDTVEATQAAIVRFLPGDRPGAVLLLTGFNNLTDPCHAGQFATPACREAYNNTVPLGVRDCMREVKEANVGVKYIFVSTLTPPGATGSQRIDRSAIEQANIRIKQFVASEGGVLVDSYAAFLGHEAEYVNVDGLHLRSAGYQALADTFFAAIKSTVPQTPLAFR